MLDPTRLTARRIQLPEDGSEYAIELGKPSSVVRLLMRDGLCLLREASPDAEVNGAPPSLGTALHQGDLISVAGTELVFGFFDEHHEPNLEAAIARDPDAEAPWAVYADCCRSAATPSVNGSPNPTGPPRIRTGSRGWTRSR